LFRMADGSPAQEDIEELEALLKKATQPKIVDRLERLLGEWRADLAVPTSAATPTASPTPNPAPATVSPTPAPAAHSPAPIAREAASRSLPAVQFVPIESFAFDQDAYPSKWVQIYITSGLDGVGVRPENVTCKFSHDAFDLQIRELSGKSYRLFKTNLENEIVPGESKCIVKMNRITLKLRKKENEFGTDHWSSLTKKRGAKSADDAAGKKDPGAGLMDLMRDLYDEGDDTMKKTIGEAMLKSRQERTGADLGDDM